MSTIDTAVVNDLPPAASAYLAKEIAAVRKAIPVNRKVVADGRRSGGMGSREARFLMQTVSLIKDQEAFLAEVGADEPGPQPSAKGIAFIRNKHAKLTAKIEELDVRLALKKKQRDIEMIHYLSQDIKGLRMERAELGMGDTA